jgi:hypothetical protein
MSDTSRSCSDAVVETWQSQSKSQSQQCRRRTTLPELLQLRQTHGMFQRHGQRQGYGSVSNLNNNRHLHDESLDYLSYRGAWNPTRLQNSILVVGPGTPASTVQFSAKAKSNKMNHQGRDNDNEEGGNEESSSSSSSSSSPSSSNSNSNSNSDENDDEEQEEDEEQDNSSNEEEHSEERERNRMDEDDDDDDEDTDAEDAEDEDAEESDDDDSGSEGFYEYMRNNGDSDDEDLSSQEEPDLNGRTRSRTMLTSMRHGGCINTSAWLTSDCGWRLSTTNNGVHAVESTEIPTQVVTSGDDRLLKVWDVAEAIGNTSPLAGGMSTWTPFSSSLSRINDDYYGYKERWQSFVDARRRNDDGEYGCSGDYHPPGTVRLLTSVSTGHKGNVFHVTPLKGRPGMFATCGADGFLRLVDVERSCSNDGGANRSSSGSGSSSTAVVHPMYDDDTRNNPRLFDPENPLAFFLRNSSGMCFSHTMIDDSDVGLLCSEKGLIRFDLRLSPREQSTKSLLPRTARSSGSMVRSMRSCKACAVLPVNTDGGLGKGNGGGSTYAFGT